MRRFLTTVVSLFILLTAVSAQTYCPECPYLGGLNPTTVVNYFKGISHPRLWTNYHNSANVNALKTKKDAGGLAGSMWSAISNRSNLNIPYRVSNAAFYYNLMGGMGATELKAFGDIVRNYDPDKHAPSAYNYPENLDKALFAYDAVAATSELSTTEKNAFIAKMLTHITGMKGRTNAPGQSGNINEHSAHTIGLCAVIFPDHADAVEWMDRSLKFLQYSFHEMTNEACIAEGQSYQLGSISGNMTPLLVTLEEHGFPVIDRDDNFLEEMWAWMVKANRPTHQTPQTEDCWGGWTCGSIWPAKYIKNDTELRRSLQWHFSKVYGSGYSPKDYITWDNALNPANPPSWNPTQFFPVSSCAVFRDSYDENGTWLYLLGDAMPFNESYAGMGGWTHNKHHGHWDATSITMQAHGEWLLTESGRFSGLNVDYHNMIMVDNETQQPSWAISSESKYTSLSDYIASPFIDAADITQTYAGNTICRTVLYPKKVNGNEYFVLIDDVEAQDGQDHFYDLQFHNSKGTIAGSGTKNWTTTTNSAVGELHFLEPDLDAAIGATRDVGGTVPYTDSYLKCRVNAAQSFQYITLMYPRTTGMTSPTVAELNGTYLRGGTMTLGSIVDAVLSQKGNQTETVGGIRTDARQALVRKTSGTPAALFVKDGTILEVDGTALLSSDVPVQLAALEYASNTRITGALILDRSANITFKSADGSVSSWQFLDAGTYENFDFTLEAGGKITGKVTDDDLGTGVAGVKVEAVQSGGTSYCYTDGSGNYTFDWVRPGATTVRFSRSGYTTAQTTGQTVTGGQTLTVNKVLAITSDAPAVINAAVLSTTNSSAVIRVVSNKPCYNQIAYGTTTSYGSNTTKTSTYTEVDTINLSGLTGGQVYHYKVTLTDYDGRTGSSADLTFAPVGDFSDDFNDSDYAPKWETASASYWSETGGVLAKTSSGNYAYDPKRLKDLILAKGALYSSFTLTGKVRSTRSSDKRDVCVVFNYEDDTHYYYAQFSMTDDSDYNGIFKVDGADKVKIGTSGSPTLSADAWIDIKIVRDMKTSAIDVYADDMTTPCFSAVDSDMGLGRIALGSERSTVEYDDFLIKPEAETGIRNPMANLVNGPVKITCTNPVTAGAPLVFNAHTVSRGDIAVTLYNGEGQPVYTGVHEAGTVKIENGLLPGGVLYYRVETAMGVQAGRTVVIK